MRKDNLVLGLLIVCCLAMAGVLGYLIVDNKDSENDNEKEETEEVSENNDVVLPEVTDLGTMSDSVTFNFVPSSANTSILESGEAQIKATTSGEKVFSIELALSYDSSKLRIDDLVPNELFPLAVGENIDNVTGLAKISLSMTGENFVADNTNIVTIKFTRIAEGSTEIKTVAGQEGAAGEKNVTRFIDLAGTSFLVAKSILTIN